MLSRKVGYQSEGRDRPVEHCPVEFAEHVRAAAIARHYYDRSSVSRAHLPVQCFLDLRVAHEYQCAWLEVEVA